MSRPRVDPKTLGAACDLCPLNGHKPVSGEFKPNPKLLVVVDAPGETEVTCNRPLAGHAGILFDTALQLENINRDDLDVTHAILCRPKYNQTPAEWKQAVQCCRPRLARELNDKNAKTILALGEKAQYALTGKAKLMDWMGAVSDGAVIKANGQIWKPLKTKPLPPDDAVRFDSLELISTFNPSYLLGNPHYNAVFRKHLRRTWDRANGKLPDWQWPHEDIEDGPGLRAALWEMFLNSKSVAVDTETDSSDTSKATLLNVGIADLTHSVSAEWQTASVVTKNLCLAILADEDITKEFWNEAYDLLVFRAQGIAVNGRTEDWMLAHSVAAPRVSHKLTHASCFEFHVPRWKTTFHKQSDDTGGEKFQKADPQERAIYNARDTWVTHLLGAPITRLLNATHNGQALYENSLKNTLIAMEMTRTGVKINRERWKERFEACTKQLADATQRLTDICAKLGVPEFNPRSHKQRQQLFNDVLEVEIPFRKGKQSLDKKALEDFRAYPDMRVRIVAGAMLDARAAKRKLDYLEALNVDVAYPGWRPGRAKTGRWASQNPNLMNIPKPIKDPQTKLVLDPGLRVLFESRPGKFLYEIDYSALEGKILALLVGDKTLLEWFSTGVDVHTRTAAILLRKEDKDVTKEERECSKGVRYGFHYGGTVNTCWRQLVVKLPHLTERMVEVLFDGLRKLHPEIVAHHASIVEFAKKNDFVEDPLSGRRYYFHGQVDRNQCLNLPIQTFASSLIDAALQRIIPRLKDGENVLMQVHDSILLEGPDWRRLHTICKEELERPVTIKGNVFAFDTESKQGTNWGNLELIR